MTIVLSILSIIGLIYLIRFYHLTGNLKKSKEELTEIAQNPEENRILHFSYPQKQAEELFSVLNDYILTSRQQQIFYQNREKKLRAQIENISHDLRTPLTSILGYLELIDRETLSEEDAESFDVIERKARALQSLIGNFYDLSRLELDDYHLSMEAVDLSRFTKETMLQSYGEFELRNLQVQIDVNENVKPVQADLGALSRIFHNMNQNALRYALSFYKVSFQQTDDHAVLSFENDCTGFQESDLEHLFERFYVKDQSRTKESTGLGLTINRLLIEAMGGTVKAELLGNVLRISYEFNLA